MSEPPESPKPLAAHQAAITEAVILLKSGNPPPEVPPLGVPAEGVPAEVEPPGDPVELGEPVESWLPPGREAPPEGPEVP